MDILLIMGVLFLAVGLPSLRIYLQLHRQRNTASTLGRLGRCDYRQNVKIRQRGQYRPKIVKHHVVYEYTYIVTGKVYRKKGFAFCSPRDLPKMPTVIYLNRFPWHAEVPKLTTDISAYFGIFCTLFGVLSLVFCLLLSLSTISH